MPKFSRALRAHKSEKVEIDQYGFIYHINKDNLIKFNLKGVPLYNYSNKLLGNITQLDISNPLRPLLFYKDQGIILALDNTLSLQKSEISLNELALYQTSCISNSNFDNGIWLYDIDVNEIVKINHQAEVVFKSGNLSVILPNMQFPVLKLFEKNKKLYVVLLLFIPQVVFWFFFFFLFIIFIFIFLNTFIFINYIATTSLTSGK